MNFWKFMLLTLISYYCVFLLIFQWTILPWLKIKHKFPLSLYCSSCPSLSRCVIYLDAAVWGVSGSLTDVTAQRTDYAVTVECPFYVSAYGLDSMWILSVIILLLLFQYLPYLGCFYHQYTVFSTLMWYLTLEILLLIRSYWKTYIAFLKMISDTSSVGHTTVLHYDFTLSV